MTWELHGNEELVGFFLVDPRRLPSPPSGFAYSTAADDPRAEGHRGADDRVLTTLELTRQERFVVAGKVLPIPGSALWMADLVPDDGARVPDGVLGAQVFLDVWVGDDRFREHMVDAGIHASLGSISMASGGGHLVAQDLRASVRVDGMSDPETASMAGEVLAFQRHGRPPLLLRGQDPIHRVVEGSWELSGDHPLGGAEQVGPTHFTAYEAPLVGTFA